MSYLGRSILVVKQLDDKYSNIALRFSIQSKLHKDK